MSLPLLTFPIILFVIGIIGTVLPLIPGVTLIWLGMLLYGFLTGFESLTLGFFILQGLAAFVVMAVDYVAAALGTKRFGGSKTAMWGAALGLFLGIIVLGPIGIIFGPLLGALIGELLRGIPLERAISSSFGALVGLLGGIILKLLIEGVMIFSFFQRI
ncbi:MAG: DUF456 domain-containing protein [Bacillota bacterium]|nr:DUF456 domain-containing protein [Bacillota bacterium]